MCCEPVTAAAGAQAAATTAACVKTAIGTICASGPAAPVVAIFALGALAAYLIASSDSQTPTRA